MSELEAQAATEKTSHPSSEPEPEPFKTEASYQLSRDEIDMIRLGRKQDFKRNYELWSMTAFAVMAMSGWIYVPNTTTSALIDGNTGRTIVMYLVNLTAFTFIILSLAEMASMAPTAAGQYHWASEFAPDSLQKVLSYTSGWLSSLVWCTGSVSGISLAGNLIQALIFLMHPGSYQQTARVIPYVESYVFGATILFFLAFLIVLWVVPENRLSAREVFSTFTNEGGWSSVGLSMLAGQALLVWGLTGSDAAAYMTEETKRASHVIPRAMIYSYVINGIMVFLFLVSYCFCLTSLEEAFKSPTGFPFIAVFSIAFGSDRAAVALTCIFVILIVLSAINYTASCSRQVWAFARDGGLPFHAWIARVDTRNNCPSRALVVVWIFNALISLIALGSSVAFNAITSVQLIALVFTYMLSICCLIWRRLYGKRLPQGEWSLGGFSLPVNIMALIYSIYLTTFVAFPITVPVIPLTFNWSPVIFVGFSVLAVLHYLNLRWKDLRRSCTTRLFFLVMASSSRQGNLQRING